VKEVTVVERHASPVVTPQALAWDGERFWLSSRDLGTLYKLDAGTLRILEEIDPPGLVWAGVFTGDGWRFTIGKGLNDDRYIYRYKEGDGFRKLFPCPELAGSYLSFDGESYYLSRWYKGQIHQLDDSGRMLRTIDIGAEICGQTFADGTLYVLRGRENAETPGKPEEWRIARVDLREQTPSVEDLAAVPFASRSLAFDGRRFWSNHRAANEIVSFTVEQ
jgi:hypothetical protein